MEHTINQDGLNSHYLQNITTLFHYYKKLGDKTLAQIPEDKIHWMVNETGNSIAVLVKHITGNMRSRFTDFLTSDGEKTWRNRDDEFIDDIKNKKELLERWESAWTMFFNTLQSLKDEDVVRIVYIRNEGHSVLQALNRQLGHYAYHIGQMVYIGKTLQNQNWQSLSIAKGQSKAYNKEKFDKEKSVRNFV